MTTAFVLSGGGSLGAVQVGMLQALDERGIAPDLLVGTSAGALNALWVAGHGAGSGSLEGLASVWRRLRRRDVLPLDPLRAVRALAGISSSLCSNLPLKRLLAAHVPFARLEGAAIPVHLVATDLLSGQEVLLSSGDPVRAALASTAIPAVYPPVEIAGRVLCDGGVADNAAVSQAIALGADRIFVLPTGFACALTRPPVGALSCALHTLTLLIEQRLIFEIRYLADRSDITVLPPLCPLTVASSDFTRAAELIDRARHATTAWLRGGFASLPHQERSLSLHHHQADAKTDLTCATDARASSREKPVA